MMTCNDVKERLTAYRDGELSPEVATQIREHLRACTTCQEDWNALTAFAETVRAWGIDVEQADLSTALAARIAAEPPAPLDDTKRLLQVLLSEMHELRGEVAQLRRELADTRGERASITAPVGVTRLFPYAPSERSLH